MLVKQKDQIKMDPVQMEDTKSVSMSVLIGENEGAPNFYMRKFELAEGGHTPHHSHDWEHVVYILEGSGTLKGKDQDRELNIGASVLVSPNEEHQFRADENSKLVFLCSIPKP